MFWKKRPTRDLRADLLAYTERITRLNGEYLLDRISRPTYESKLLMEINKFLVKWKGPNDDIRTKL